VRQQLDQQLLGLLPVVGTAGLHEGDRPRHQAPVAGEHAVDQRGQVRHQ
jgi:hypothetical protein